MVRIIRFVVVQQKGVPPSIFHLKAYEDDVSGVGGRFYLKLELY